MSTQALTADAKVLDGVTYVSSSQATTKKAYLDSDFDADDVVRFEATGAGAIEICTEDGARIGFCPPERSVIVSLDDAGNWNVGPVLAASPVATITKPATTAATSTTPFGFAEAQANAIVTALNAVVDQLILVGIVKAE